MTSASLPARAVPPPFGLRRNPAGLLLPTTKQRANAIRNLKYLCKTMNTITNTTCTRSPNLTTLDDANSILLSYMFSGAVGSAEGMGVTYSVIGSDDHTFTYIAGLDPEDDVRKSTDRFRVIVDRMSGKAKPAELVSISTTELSKAILDATGHHLATVSRFTDGLMSISYKVSVMENPNTEYIAQLRYHGDVTSMNYLMKFVSSNIGHHILPVPTVYPLKAQEEQQIKSGMGLQIAQFIPGVMANVVYPAMTHSQKLQFLPRLALAFDALWTLSVPGERLIGEIKATCVGEDGISLSISPDRHYSLGGPFASVADYLRAFIRAHLKLFRKQEGISDYKALYLERVTDFVDTGMHNIPPIVETIPVVLLHQDMGLHNIIVSETEPTHITAIIDWELCGSGPYASLHKIIESLFRMPNMNGFGQEYPHAGDLRKAFWSAIPQWEIWNESEATRVFMEWFRFALFMKAEWRPDNLTVETKDAYWAENVNVVEGFLSKYDTPRK